jgi:transposase
MLDMVDVEYIRKLSLVKRWSDRQIARQLGVSRNTVAKYLSAPDPTPRYRLAIPRPRPVLGAFEGVIRLWLDEDKQRPRKQRHTAHRIYERLRDEYFFPGGESTIRKYVRSVKAPVPEAFLPLEYELGSEAQCDFGEADVIFAGVQVTIHLFCMRLMAGARSFVVAFPPEKSEAFYEGHRRAFELFGGVPRRVRYDNPKVAVKKILGPRERTEQKGFVALRSHYLFESLYCLPGRKGAHEKGGVENLVGYCRRNYLVPLPEVKDFGELNALLKERCLAEGSRQLPGGKGTLADRWEQERSHLLPLPAYPFSCCRTEPADVNRLQLVAFDRCRYSVPTRFVGRTVTVYGYVDRIEIGCGSEMIAEHARLYEAGAESFKAEHYLDQLDQKPSAVINARVFRSLTEPYQFFRKRCLDRVPPQPREFVEVLKLLREFPPEVVEQAVAEAVKSEVYRADAVAQICRRLTQPQSPAPVVHALNVPMPPPDLSHFDNLLAGVAG